MSTLSGQLLDKLEELIALIIAKSYREKSHGEEDFILASGQKSRFYLDLKATTLHPRGATLVGELLKGLIVEASQKTGFKVQGVGGLTLGADPLATATSIAALQNHLEWPAFIVRKESKGHGTSRAIEGAENLAPGASVVVLEDVVTTGGSGLQAVAALRQAGYNPVLVAAVVDRGQGGQASFEAQGLKLVSLTTLQEIQTRVSRK